MLVWRRAVGMKSFLAASYSKSDEIKRVFSAVLGGRALIGWNSELHSHWSGQFIAVADGSYVIGETFFHVRMREKAVST